jgi:hypothetical protein
MSRRSMVRDVARDSEAISREQVERAHKSIKNRLGSALLALIAISTTSLAAATPARAVEPGSVLAVVSAVKGAYETYNTYFAGALTLEQATTKIIDAINSAKSDIIRHIDRIAAAQVQSCARSAVIDVADLPTMTQDNLQAFAREATTCVTQADALIRAADDQAAIDQLGFALDTVGPIALLARAHAGLTTPLLKETLVSANNNIVAKLTTSCDANPLWGDARPGDIVQIRLRCRAYNGDEGRDWAHERLPWGGPLPTFDYSTASARALRNTSYPVAVASLAVLQA